MESSARKLHSVPTTTQAYLSVQTYEEFRTLIDMATPLAAYKIDSSSEEIIRMVREGITLVCISAAAIHPDNPAFHAIPEHLGRPDIAVCAIGSEEELNRLAGEYEQGKLSIIPLPLSILQLKFQLDNLYDLQKKILLSETTRSYVETTNESVKYVLKVSQELGGIHDTDKLLSLILKKAREFCHADAGSVYVVDWQDHETQNGKIHFKITQNESIEQNLAEFTIAIDTKSIVGNSVIHATSINIPDLYKLDNDPSKNPYNAKHNRTWDLKTGYQCRSMLTLPMFDIQNRVIGVIQLINRKKTGVSQLTTADDFDEKVLPFDVPTVAYVEIIAKQAGVALENALLNQEKENLFSNFVGAAITAVEQRDQNTSGHSQRVAAMTHAMALAVNKQMSGPLARYHFNDDQLKEIEFASLLHDFGKIGINEQILVKQNRLTAWQLELIKERFEHAKTRIEIKAMRGYFRYLETPEAYPPGFDASSLYDSKDEMFRQLDYFWTIINKSNAQGILNAQERSVLDTLSHYHYDDPNNQSHPLVDQVAYESLAILHGILTPDEQDIMQTHVTKTYEFLRKIPWGDRFSNVPQIAAKHHEKLDGTGYPTHAAAGEIPVQSRMIAIAEIYDTIVGAGWRQETHDEAIRHLEAEVRDNKIDADLTRLFIGQKIFEECRVIAKET